MRIWDAIAAAKPGRRKKAPVHELTTRWSEALPANAVPRDYPRPQFRRNKWICLNGEWEYAFTKSGSRPKQFDGKILVPFSPESRRSGVNRQLKPGEYLWYFRNVELPNLPDGYRMVLHFGAVDQQCSVWWNGKKIGSHTGGYLSFSFDVTKQVRAGKNTVWVRVQDDTERTEGSRGKQSLRPGGMFYTAQSGIWQTVWMEWVPVCGVDNLKLTPLFDEKAVRVELSVTDPMSFEIWIGIDGKSVCHYIRKRELEADGVSFRKEIVLSEIHPWTPEHPRLYEVCVVAGTDCVHSYFALRKFSVGADEKQIPRLLLNNQPYFFNGVLDQGYWPESLYTPPHDEAMIFDIQNMKRLGFNMIRKHCKIEPMRWYYHCDTIGMVVWQDIVNGGGPIRLPLVCHLPTVLPFLTDKIKDNVYWFFARTDKKQRGVWEEECMETVRQLYNCPCIGLWVPFNEGWGQFDALRIAKRIRREDPSRLVDHASGWFDQGGGDVKSVHNYFRPLRVKKDRRPFVISEYGGYSLQVWGHIYSQAVYGYRSFRTQREFTEAFKVLQRKIYALEREGLSAAVYTQVSDVEEENNGLYTYDRKVCKVLDEEAQKGDLE